MDLFFMRQKDLLMASSGERVQPKLVLAVLITLCVGFEFSVVASA